MNAVRQPLLGLPTNTACLRQRPPHPGFPSFSKARSRVQVSLQLCSKGVSLSPSGEGDLSFYFLGAWNVLVCSRGYTSRQNKRIRVCTTKIVRTPRCGIATGAQVSNGDWNQNAASPKGPTIGQRVRAFCFYLTTYVVALPLFFVMLVVQPFVLMFDKHKRKAQHYINKIWASLTIYPFYRAEIEGCENLPGPDVAAVYVSNHQSFLDIYTLFLLDRPFKFISKTSNFLIPIIGWSMYLTGHVPLRRMDTRSHMECLGHCQKLISQGVPVFFFPEGTRSRDGKMGQFKRGAFTIAAKAEVPVVPISLIGTGKLMPNGFEGTLRPGVVKVIIHPPVRGRNPDDLCEQARDVISKSLLEHGLGVH